MHEYDLHTCPNLLLRDMQMVCSPPGQAVIGHERKLSLMIIILPDLL